MISDPEWSSNLTIRLTKTNDLIAPLNKVKEIFAQYNPAYPFEYTFVDCDF